MHKFQNKRCSLPPDHVPAVFFTHNWVMAFSSLQNFEDRTVPQKYGRFWTEIWNQRHGCNMEYLDEKKYKTSGNVKDFERRVWGSHLLGEVWMFPRKRELRNVERKRSFSIVVLFFRIFQFFSSILFFSIAQFFSSILFFRIFQFSVFSYFSVSSYFSVLQQNQITSHWIRELIRSKQMCSNPTLIF